MTTINPFHIAIISHKRPQNVPKVQAITGYDVTWYVGKGEVRDYELYGAKVVVEAGGLCRARNLAIEDAFGFGKICVQLSDDFSGLKMLTEPKLKTAVKTPFMETLFYMLNELDKTPYKLAGVAPTPNAFFYHSDFSTNLFVVGDFIMIKPCVLCFDEGLRLKEDYDYTVQHFKSYGGALRINRVLATFAHRTNKGGAVDYRTEEMEQEQIAFLMQKHPDCFRLNSRRKNEILIVKKKWD